MTSSYFISLFTYVCNIFWSFFLVLYRIPLTAQVCFGDVLLIALIFLLMFYFIMRPYKR